MQVRWIVPTIGVLLILVGLIQASINFVGQLRQPDETRTELGFVYDDEPEVCPIRDPEAPDSGPERGRLAFVLSLFSSAGQAFQLVPPGQPARSDRGC